MIIYFLSIITSKKMNSLVPFIFLSFSGKLFTKSKSFALLIINTSDTTKCSKKLQHTFNPTDFFSFSNLSLLTFFLALVFVISARRDSPLNDRRLCPEEYRELRRRNDDSSSDSDDDGGDDDDEWDELCRAALQEPQSMKSQSLLRAYCPYLDEALELARTNNDTLCEMKKRALIKRSYGKRKRQSMKKKRYDDSSDDDDEKRRSLRKRKLHKRVALRFIRKSL